jgi:hypothetical protein
MFIRYKYNGETFFEDQAGTSRTWSDVNTRAQELCGDVVDDPCTGCVAAGECSPELEQDCHSGVPMKGGE